MRMAWRTEKTVRQERMEIRMLLLTANADGTADGSDGSGLGSGSDGMNESADGDAMAAANAGGTADGSDGENAGGTNGNDTTDAAEAASASIISEQTLMDNGVSYEAQGASLLWPAASTILIDYSMDGSVYFPTLNQYKYNPALVIGSDTGNQVLAAAKGIVESTYVDEETGTTLVLNIGNGYKLTYGGLKELQAKEGDVLESGAVIGYVSEPTKYYSTEGSNVYFAMTKDRTGGSGAVSGVRTRKCDGAVFGYEQSVKRIWNIRFD